MKKLFVFVLLLIPFFLFANDISDTVEDVISLQMEALSADKAIGTPLQVGDKTIIPLFEANLGFGGGLGGPGEVYGGGAGGGMDLLPYSVIIISSDGFQVIPVSNRVPILHQLVDVLPKLLPIIMQYFGS